jgi:hypothetical protein
VRQCNARVTLDGGRVLVFWCTFHKVVEAGMAELHAGDRGARGGLVLQLRREGGTRGGQHVGGVALPLQVRGGDGTWYGTAARTGILTGIRTRTRTRTRTRIRIRTGVCARTYRRAAAGALGAYAHQITLYLRPGENAHIRRGSQADASAGCNQPPLTCHLLLDN